MKRKEKLDDLIEDDPRHNIFTLLILNSFFAVSLIILIYKIIDHLFF